jgi:sodium/proline symporter
VELYDKLSHPVALIVFLLTLFLPIFIGFLTMRRTRSQSDFFIGGRSMDKLVVALSAISTGRSSWLVLGVSGIAYLRGVGAVWALVGYIVAELFQFIYIGHPLREQTEEFKSLTLLDYFETKFNDKKNLIRITGSTIIIFFMTIYVAAQFRAGAKALSTGLAIPLIAALAISGVLILVYMVLGGYIAVAYNDVVRAFILLVGLVIFPIYGLIRIGGLKPLLEMLSQLNPSLIDPFSLGMGVIVGYVGIGLGSPGQPHIIVRYMSIDDPDKLRFSSVIGTLWNVLMGWGAIFIGLLGRVIVPSIEKLPGRDEEVIYLVLSSEYFGPALYGLIIGGIFAAILSTADSQLLVVASTLVRDIYEKILKKGMLLKESNKLKLSRSILLFAGILAIFIAYIAKDNIFWLVLFAFGGMGASLGPTLILSLFWKKANKYGIFAGMITGTLVIIIWKLFFKATTGIYELIPAFVTALVAIVIISVSAESKRSKENI